MKGWKTWSAVVGLTLLGVVDIANGEPDSGMNKIVMALAMVGLGSKIEKNG